MTLRSYSELSRLETFEERFEYLKLGGNVGASTFGFDRQWEKAREEVIIRDNGCDLGVIGYEIHVEILIHHITPIVLSDIIHGEPWLFDPENLITTTKKTHNAIHYGRPSPYPRVVVSRTPNDTRLW